MSSRLTKDALKEAIRESGLWEEGGAGREALREEVYADPEAPYAKDINRLISSWHPTGKVLFQDDMESLIADASNHYRGIFGVGGAVERANDRSFHGQYALKLTTSALATATATAIAYLCLPNYQTRIGLELKFISDAEEPNLEYIRFALVRYDGEYHHEANFIYYGVLREWRRFDRGAIEVPVFDQWLNVSATEPSWNGMKMIVDFEKDTYDTFICNEKSIDLKGEPLYVTPETTIPPELVIYMEIMTKTDTSISMWVDDLILTDEGA